jgi:hypothetical protein
MDMVVRFCSFGVCPPRDAGIWKGIGDGYFVPEPPKAAMAVCGLGQLGRSAHQLWTCGLPNTHHAWRDHTERFGQVRRPIPEHFSHNVRFGLIRQSGQAQQHYASMDAPLTEDKLAEVLVRRHQEGVLVVGLLQDFVVGDAGGQLRT